MCLECGIDKDNLSKVRKFEVNIEYFGTVLPLPPYMLCSAAFVVPAVPVVSFVRSAHIFADISEIRIHNRKMCSREILQNTNNSQLEHERSSLISRAGRPYTRLVPDKKNHRTR